MGHNKSKQSGFTLVELLVVVAVMGFVTAVMVLMFNMVTKVSNSSMSQNIVLSQVQAAGNWLSRDIMSAENVTTYLTGTRLAKIFRYQWNGTDNITTVIIDYDIIDNKLLRAVDYGQSQVVAQFISGNGAGTDLAPSTSISENNTYIFTVESVYRNSSFSRVYKINQRIH